MAKVKIVLDADVIIHFSKGECLNILPKIFDNYDYIILDKVYEELNTEISNQIDNIICHFKNLEIVVFNPTNADIQKEYARLIKILHLGKGETATMLYCKESNDVVASSNLTDTKNYCDTHGITYITTLDFVHHAAIVKKIITIEKANIFIQMVKDKGSKLPKTIVDISRYTPTVTL